jgi:hypothetical protein
LLSIFFSSNVTDQEREQKVSSGPKEDGRQADEVWLWQRQTK